MVKGQEKDPGQPFSPHARPGIFAKKNIFILLKMVSQFFLPKKKHLYIRWFLYLALVQKFLNIILTVYPSPSLSPVEWGETNSDRQGLFSKKKSMGNASSDTFF